MNKSLGWQNGEDLNQQPYGIIVTIIMTPTFQRYSRLQTTAQSYPAIKAIRKPRWLKRAALAKTYRYAEKKRTPYTYVVHRPARPSNAAVYCWRSLSLQAPAHFSHVLVVDRGKTIISWPLLIPKVYFLLPLHVLQGFGMRKIVHAPHHLRLNAAELSTFCSISWSVLTVTH